MKRLKVYLDTSVVSYLHQEDAPEKMQDTLSLWELFKQGVYEVYVSDIVFREIDRCSEEKLNILLDYLDQIEYHELETDSNTIELAGKFVDFGILKKKSFDENPILYNYFILKQEVNDLLCRIQDDINEQLKKKVD